MPPRESVDFLHHFHLSWYLSSDDLFDGMHYLLRGLSGEGDCISLHVPLNARGGGGLSLVVAELSYGRRTEAI